MVLCKLDKYCVLFVYLFYFGLIVFRICLNWFFRFLGVVVRIWVVFKEFMSLSFFWYLLLNFFFVVLYIVSVILVLCDNVLLVVFIRVFVFIFNIDFILIFIWILFFLNWRGWMCDVDGWVMVICRNFNINKCYKL